LDLHPNSSIHGNLGHSDLNSLSGHSSHAYLHDVLAIQREAVEDEGGVEQVNREEPRGLSAAVNGAGRFCQLSAGRFRQLRETVALTQLTAQ
jgi:hypothetical protein